MGLDQIMQENLKTRFSDNPCRGIVLGLSPSGKGVQISWIMGRSESSQNRLYIRNKDGVKARGQSYLNRTVRTEAADPSKLNPLEAPLIIYPAMQSYGAYHIVSNGRQTTSVYEGFRTGIDTQSIRLFPSHERFFKLLEEYSCENDFPVLTPRITGYQDLERDAAISIIKPDPVEKAFWISVYNKVLAADQIESKIGLEFMELCLKLEKGTRFPSVRAEYKLKLHPGVGYCVTTYKPGDSKNLTPFDGEPFVVPIQEDLRRTMISFWRNLASPWKVALAGKEFTENGVEIELINTHQRINPQAV